MKKLLLSSLFAACSLITRAQDVDTTQQIVPGRVNSAKQQDKPYVILISADGFRYDYAEKYNAVHLLNFANEGVKASSMIPSFPSSTYPNHYAMATGLYPAHNGIVQNIFYDRTEKRYYNSGSRFTTEESLWYGGTPLWVLAEQQHMLAANFYWVASNTQIKGIYSTYYYMHNSKIPIDRRIQAVVNWLKLPAEKRPHLITFYLPQVDDAGHKYGPESKPVADAVLSVDSTVNELAKAVSATGLKVNFIFVSDHGMGEPDTKNPLPTPAALDTSKFIISGDRMVVELIAKDPADIKKTYDALKKEGGDYDVYLRENMPEHLHSSTKDDRFNRVGDIILLPHWPKLFNIYNHKLDKGQHGYDPAMVKDVHAIFYAWGPDFKTHTVVAPFPNVDIYPLVTELLGLKITEKIDGSKQLAKEVLLEK
jgi:predicted AlkP superfamily pyrophosphatase or phosphodiesterase